MIDQDNNRFDEGIIEQLSEGIPSEVVTIINPWRKPLNNITWGFILSLFTLNFAYLQYILPTIGIILIYLGFRSLRNENKWFRICLIYSSFYLLLYPVLVLFDISPLWNDDYSVMLGIILTIFRIIFFLIFRYAIRMVFCKAGQKQKGDPLLWAAIWMSIVLIIGLVGTTNSLLIFIPVILCYIIIFGSLFQVGKSLDDTGYRLKNAPIKVEDSVVTLGYILFITVFIVLTCIFSNHLVVKGVEYEKPAMNSTRELLIQKGFPKDELQYLGNEDVNRLSDVENIKTVQETIDFKNDNSLDFAYFSDKKLKVVDIFIRTKSDDQYVMSYFEWMKGKAYWQDAIEILPDSNAKQLNLISSGLVYNKKGKSYHAPFPRIYCGNELIQSFVRSYNHLQIYGALNYPYGSMYQRGYVLYHYKVEKEPFAIFTLLNYVHNPHPINLPYVKTEEKLLKDGYDITGRWRQVKADYDE